MKINWILGILWLICNCVGIVTVGKTLIMSVPDIDSQSLYFSFLGSLLLLDVVGIVASLFLLRGATWARWFLGPYAVVLVAGTISRAVKFGPPSASDIIYGLFALVSAIILLAPKRKEKGAT